MKILKFALLVFFININLIGYSQNCNTIEVEYKKRESNLETIKITPELVIKYDNNTQQYNLCNSNTFEASKSTTKIILGIDFKIDPINKPNDIKDKQRLFANQTKLWIYKINFPKQESKSIIKALSTINDVAKLGKNVSPYTYEIDVSKLKSESEIRIQTDIQIVSNKKRWRFKDSESAFKKVTEKKSIEFKFTIKPYKEEKQIISDEKEILEDSATQNPIEDTDATLNTNQEQIEEIIPLEPSDELTNALEYKPPTKEWIAELLQKEFSELDGVKEKEYNKHFEKLHIINKALESTEKTLEEKVKEINSHITALENLNNKKDKANKQIILLKSAKENLENKIEEIKKELNNTKLSENKIRFVEHYTKEFSKREAELKSIDTVIKSIVEDYNAYRGNEISKDEYREFKSKADSISDVFSAYSLFKNTKKAYDKIRHIDTNNQIKPLIEDIVSLSNRLNNETGNFDNYIENLEGDAGITWWDKNSSWFLVLLFFLVLIGGFAGYYVYKKRQAQKNYEQIEFVSSDVANDTSETLKNNELIAPSNTNIHSEASKVTSEISEDDDDIEIVILDENETQDSQLNKPNYKASDYVNFNLSEMWEDTVVTQVKMHHKVCIALYNFSESSLAQKPAPEVGGFLLGSFNETEDKEFEVIIEKFLPSKNVEYQNNYELSFGTQSLLELDEALEKNPHLKNVGWFHTHPGHTPFLSNKDIHLHEGSFPFNWQIAVVLDPNTAKFDTGIFSYKKNKLLNNKVDLISDFYSWEAVKENALSKLGKSSKNTSDNNYYKIDTPNLSINSDFIGISRALIIKIKQLAQNTETLGTSYIIKNADSEKGLLLEDIVSKAELTENQISNVVGQFSILKSINISKVRIKFDDKNFIYIVYIGESNHIKLYYMDNVQQTITKDIDFKELTDWLRLM